jgi:hypothetical protein
MCGAVRAGERKMANKKQRSVREDEVFVTQLLADPKVRQRLVNARRVWGERTMKLKNNVKRSQRLTAADLAVRINATL